MAAATSAAAGVSPGKHDGIICNAKPNGPTVHGAPDDDARAGTDAMDAAAADDVAAIADGGTNGAIVSRDTAVAIGLAENAAAGPASTALCWIRNGINHGGKTFDIQGRTNR